MLAPCNGGYVSQAHGDDDAVHGCGGEELLPLDWDMEVHLDLTQL